MLKTPACFQSTLADDSSTESCGSDDECRPSSQASSSERVWLSVLRDKIHNLQQGLRSKRRSLSFSSGSSSRSNGTRRVRRSISVHDKGTYVHDSKFKMNTSHSSSQGDSDDDCGGFTSALTFTRVGSLRTSNQTSDVIGPRCIQDRTPVLSRQRNQPVKTGGGGSSGGSGGGGSCGL